MTTDNDDAAPPPRGLTDLPPQQPRSDWYLNQQPDTIQLNQNSRRRAFLTGLNQSEAFTAPPPPPPIPTPTAEVRTTNIDIGVGSADLELDRATPKVEVNDVGQRPPLKIVMLNTGALIKAFELVVDYDPQRSHNQSKPELILDLKVEDPQDRADIKELIDELKRLRATLEASKEPAPEEKGRLAKLFGGFLEKYGETMGTGAGYLTLGAISTVLTYCGAGEVVGFAMAWKTILDR